MPIFLWHTVFKIKKYLTEEKNIIWGIGPWSLAGALIKLLYFRKKIFLFSDYFTTVKHEYHGSVQAVNSNNYGYFEILKKIVVFNIFIPLFSILEKLTLVFSDTIITHYNSTEEIISHQFGIKPGRFSRLPYTIEERKTGNVIKYKTKYSRPLILTISRHDARKGINYLLHSYNILKKKKIKFSGVLIGDGDLLHSHKLLADKLRLNNIIFPGTKTDVKNIFKQTDLFVLPSLEEGSSSIALLEAMAAGIPVIASDIDGIKEDIESGKNGFLFQPKSPYEMAALILMLLKNKELAKKIGHEGKKFVLEKYDEKITQKSLKNFLNKYFND
jgi:glycosyltransferase involved in cell wall biosynthesis